jgi:predicted AAA+ superfamily ATPase
LLAARSGRLLNVSGLGTELRLDAKTVASYVSLLEQLGLLIRLPAWFANLGHRVVKTPKVHLADSGLHVHLIGADADQISRQPGVAGPVVETFVVDELMRQSGWASSAPSLHHFRSHWGDKVDVVLHWRDGSVAGVEVKSGASVTQRDFAGLKTLRDRLGPRFVCGVVLYTGERTVPAGDRLWAVPLEGLWSPSTTPASADP